MLKVLHNFRIELYNSYFCAVLKKKIAALKRLQDGLIYALGINWDGIL